MCLLGRLWLGRVEVSGPYMEVKTTPLKKTHLPMLAHQTASSSSSRRSCIVVHLLHALGHLQVCLCDHSLLQLIHGDKRLSFLWVSVFRYNILLIPNREKVRLSLILKKIDRDRHLTVQFMKQNLRFLRVILQPPILSHNHDFLIRGRSSEQQPWWCQFRGDTLSHLWALALLSLESS